MTIHTHVSVEGEKIQKLSIHSFTTNDSWGGGEEY